MNLDKTTLGSTPDGDWVDEYILANANGLKAKVMTYGATLTTVESPDRNGRSAIVTLYLDSLEAYLAGHPFFGSIAGRYANRIAKGRFTLEGETYRLATNNGPNHLHGGLKGFDKAVWAAKPIEGQGFVGVWLSHESPDGDEGYPGTLTAEVSYTISSDNQLKMEYTARTDRPTHVNLTNHAYWNLSGAGSGEVLGHELTINADRYLPVDETLIPLGEPASVRDTPLDFTEPTTIGARIKQVEPGYDHCYVLNRQKEDELSFAARAIDPNSGRVMEVHTTQPGIQLYTANFLDGTLAVAGSPCRKHHGFCLETQHYPDSPNKPQYPSTVLRPGEVYHQVTVHKFSVQM